jgi:hypothetical protein
LERRQSKDGAKRKRENSFRHFFAKRNAKLVPNALQHRKPIQIAFLKGRRDRSDG